MKEDIKEAVARLCEELRTDKDYFYSWQANIAVAFQDAYKRLPDKDIHEISNVAAKDFLNLLIMPRN